MFKENSEFKVELAKYILNKATSSHYTLTNKLRTSLVSIIIDLERKEVCNDDTFREIFVLFLAYLAESKLYCLLNK